MYAAAALIVSLIMIVFYLSQNKVLSIVFISISACYVFNVWKSLSSRREIWDYLVRHSYDMLPSYARIEYYDKAIGVYCGFALMLAVIVTILSLLKSDFINRICDAVVFIMMIIMGISAFTIILVSLNAYYDSAQIYTAPAVKGGLILLASFTVRKIIAVTL